MKLATELEERRRGVEEELIEKWRNSKAVPIPGAQDTATVLARRTAIDGFQLEFCQTPITWDAIPACSVKREIRPVDIYLPSFGTTVIQTDSTHQRDGDAPLLDPLPSALEPLLPYYSEFSVAMRELLHDQSSDQARKWRRQDSLITMTTTDYGDGGLQITLSPVLLESQGDFDPRQVHSVPARVARRTIVVALFVVRFVSRKVFLLDLPLWSPGTDYFPSPHRSVFAVCRSPQARKAYLGGRPTAVDFQALAADGAPQQQLDLKLADFDKQCPGVPILIDHFEHGTSDKDLNEKLRLIEELVQVRCRTVIVLSAVGPASLQRGARAQRWVELLKSFVIIDLDPFFETEAESTVDSPGNTATQQPGRDRRTGWLSRIKDLLPTPSAASSDRFGTPSIGRRLTIMTTSSAFTTT